MIWMCGIIVCNSGNNSLYYAEQQLKDRGTDSHCRVEKDGITFSHFLHSVVGWKVKQPFVGKGVLVANCEIYNWGELAQKYCVEGRNDAETLFGILEKSNGSKDAILKTISELDGDFACIYYRNHKIFAFRDPIGVNPLFYSLNPLFFASERKACPEILCELHPRTVLIYNTQSGKTSTHYTDIFRPAKCKLPYSRTRDLLFEAIDKRIAKVSSGILFSGGIDSAFLALRLVEKGVKPVLYTSFSGKNSEDIKYAREFAEEYKFKHVEIEITEKELEKELPNICHTIDSNDSVKVSVAIPIYFAARRASQDNIKVLYSGLGADDIFAGYARFRKGHETHKEQLSSLRNIYERDLYRDNCLAMHNSTELRVPYLDIALIQHSLSLPDALLTNKKILRRILKEHYSLDEKFYGRPKKAAQYGAKTMSLLRSLAKKNKSNTNTYLFGIYNRKNIPLASLYTGGKDSAYALYLMAKRNYDIRCLITIKSTNRDSYMYHTPRIDEASNHARKMSLPLILQETAGEKEKELRDLEKAIRKAINQYKIEGVITGALYSDYQRSRIESVCDRLGICTFSPLWHIDQEMHMRRLIRDGFKFIFTSVAAEGLDNSWLNREITGKDIDKLVRLHNKHGINVAGEGGEFESLVVDCPLFRGRI